MAGRFKIFTFIISGVVLITILVGPPLAFTVNLPTVCNIFHKKHSTDKSGHCGSQTLLSKVQAKSFEGGIVHVFSTGSGIESAISQDIYLASLLPSTTSPQFTPLRC
jgi:hypothetical protein